MDLIFAYLAGLLTLINPCILPVLPLVLGSAASGDRRGPVALAAGLSLSFVILGVLVTAFGYAIGLTPDVLATVGAVAMIGFGLMLLTPALSARFELATAGLAGRADAHMGAPGADPRSQFFGGLLLGTVWSPCIGPTLGGAIALASQGQNLGWATAIMLAFSAGVSTLILIFGLGAQDLLARHRGWLQAVAQRSKPILGLLFLGLGIATLTGITHMAEGWLVETMPVWLQDFSVRY
ncbi:cytochrome c biogenesis protein CcdA [Rhodobacteraceae bacterium KN286]|uniref:Cytochrome c biogenesis protein CcdA n=2 Tax=Oceanomicrobium pacificus TaxID=2692916 RepID=A0A6B0TJM4_9RHOB|nr:cytochrome c biogenesis protein CcdA [Oceanomicrobium pacificus]